MGAAEALLSRLKKDGKLVGLHGGLEITAVSVDGRRLVEPALRRKDSAGRVVINVDAVEGEVGNATDAGEMPLLLREGSVVGKGLDGIGSKTFVIRPAATR
jgi:hypothetical protein